MSIEAQARSLIMERSTLIPSCVTSREPWNKSPAFRSTARRTTALTQWHTIKYGQARYADAQIRHELSLCKGETHDAESGLHHLSHEAWNVLARLELMLRQSE